MMAKRIWIPVLCLVLNLFPPHASFAQSGLTVEVPVDFRDLPREVRSVYIRCSATVLPLHGKLAMFTQEALIGRGRSRSIQVTGDIRRLVRVPIQLDHFTKVSDIRGIRCAAILEDRNRNRLQPEPAPGSTLRTSYEANIR